MSIITKRELAAISKRERTAGFDKPTQPVKPNVAGVLVKNTSGAAIGAGGVLCISGYVSPLSFDEAKRRSLNGEIILNGIGTTGATAAALATALEPIPAGAVGRCALPVVFSPVTITNANYTQADAALSTVETGGVWQILAKSATQSGAAFCALAKLSGGSSGGGGSSESITYLTSFNISQGWLTFNSTTKTVMVP